VDLETQICLDSIMQEKFLSQGDLEKTLGEAARWVGVVVEGRNDDDERERVSVRQIVQM
jgi:hypothetical protein